MSELNYIFFDEYKRLDNICRDIYGKSTENKLGVTLYLEDMNNKMYIGSNKVQGWVSDYNKLKNVRNIRNELAHSSNSFTLDICSQEDVNFICQFRNRILQQTDPIALLRLETNRPHTMRISYSEPQPQSARTVSTTSTTHKGCLSVVGVLIFIVVCIIFMFI